MAEARFVLNTTGISARFQFILEDNSEKPMLRSQLRHQKPMCLDEVKWIRKIAAKDSSYERVHGEKGYYYIIRAGDGHELGRGNYHGSEKDREQEIAFVKEHAADAQFLDKTPVEARIKAKDYVSEKSLEVLRERGVTFG